MPDSFSADEKQQLKSQYKTLILDKLVPAYQRMSDFLLNDYIPYARDSVGYADLPNGKAWYEYQIKKNTTLSLSADEIHEIGLSEVARILSEMKTVKNTVEFEGELSAFF